MNRHLAVMKLSFATVGLDHAVTLAAKCGVIQVKYKYLIKVPLWCQLCGISCHQSIDGEIKIVAN